MISRPRLPGSRPQRPSAPWTSARNSGRASWRPETLTVTPRSAACGKRSRHCATCAVACSSTQRAERGDEAGLLGEADELGRADDAVARAVPAHERLDAEQPVLGDVEDRLVVDAELLALDGAAQVALGPQAREGVLAHLLVEELVAAAAALLGPVHRGVGLAEHRLGALGPARDRDADARRDEDLAAGPDRDRPLPGVGDALGDGERLGLGLDLAAGRRTRRRRAARRCPSRG